MTQLLADPTATFITNGHKSLYISTCNVCGLGVFQTQRWEFSRRPLGICHTDCLETQVQGGAR